MKRTHKSGYIGFAELACSWIWLRLRAASTWLALSVPVGLLGTQLDDPIERQRAYVAAAVMAMIGKFIRKPKNEDDDGDNSDVAGK